MQVKDIMTESPACCTPESSLTEVAKMMVDCDCGEIPVVDDGKKPIGVVTDRDIVCRSVAVGKNPLPMKAGDCMSSPCVTVNETASVDECIRMMEQNQVRRIPVVDDDGKICGIVSQADIARYASEHQTAEVVQEVSAIH